MLRVVSDISNYEGFYIIFVLILYAVSVNRFFSTYFFVLTIGAILSSCMSSVQITSVVEKNKKGDFLLKWEVSPDQEGDIQIYSSLSDSAVSLFVPITTAQINEQFAVFNPAGTGLRQYFVLKTAGATSGIIANRVIDMDNIQNFRDLGGYFTEDGKQMRWGQLYRSGDLSRGGIFDLDRIYRLKIKTIIDFRTEQFSQEHPVILAPGMKHISLPIIPGDLKDMVKQVERQSITRSDAIIFVQDSYIRILDEYKRSLSEMFAVLSDEKNYPVVIASNLGKDRVGLASYLILYALGIPDYVIEDDYMMSNAYLDPHKYVDFTQLMTESTQEAITAMLSANRAYLRFATDYIKKKYGSIDNYLEKELKLNNRKRAALRKQLLYNP